jgi:hypothetical protein
MQTVRDPVSSRNDLRVLRDRARLPVEGGADHGSRRLNMLPMCFWKLQGGPGDSWVIRGKRMDRGKLARGVAWTATLGGRNRKHRTTPCGIPRTSARM